jgi:hypothetical protein
MGGLPGSPDVSSGGSHFASGTHMSGSDSVRCRAKWQRRPAALPPAGLLRKGPATQERERTFPVRERTFPVIREVNFGSTALDRVTVKFVWKRRHFWKKSGPVCIIPR